MIDNKKAYIAATIYAIIIGFSFMLVKIALRFADPLDILAHRFTMAWLAATIMFLIKREPIHVTKKGFLLLAILSLLYPIAFFLFQVFGLLHTSSSEGGIINATTPIFTLIFATLLLKEKSTNAQKAAIVLSVIGVMYIMYMTGISYDNTNLIGSLLILLSALTFSLYQVISRRLTQTYSLFTITYVTITFGFVVINVVAITNHFINGTMHQFIEPIKHVDFLLAVGYLGALSTFSTSYLANYSLKQLPASQVSVFTNLATLITILAGIIFLHESFHYYHVIGTFLIIAGVISVNYLGEKKVARYLKNIKDVDAS